MIISSRRAALVGILAAGLVTVTGPSASSTGPADSAVRVGLIDGRLAIVGSPKPDTVSIRLGSTGSDLLEVHTGATRSPDFRVRRAEVTKGIEASLGSGDDTFLVVETGGIFTNSIPTTVEGGDGADHLVGGSGGETLRGGAGADLVEGGGGPDQIILGDAADTVLWTADDGDDIIDGGSGTDRAMIRGADTGDLLNVSDVGGGVAVSPGSSASAQFWDVEFLSIATLAGSDKVVLDDLSGTGVTEVVADFAPTVGGSEPDHLLDALVVEGTDGADSINLSGPAGAVELTGLAASIHIQNADPRYPHDESDLLAIATGDGDDVVTAFGLSPDAIRFVVA